MSDNRQPKPFSIRMNKRTLGQLESHARRRVSQAQIAERLIDEGMRLEDFSGIVFREFPQTSCSRVRQHRRQMWQATDGVITMRCGDARRSTPASVTRIGSSKTPLAKAWTKSERSGINSTPA